jgi:hypothetical protein
MTSKSGMKMFQGCRGYAKSVVFGTCLRSFRISTTFRRSKIQRTLKLKVGFSIRRTGFAARAADCRPQSETVAVRSAPSGTRADANGLCGPDLRSPENRYAQDHRNSTFSYVYISVIEAIPQDPQVGFEV